MQAPSLPELHAFHAASTGAQPGDFVVQWQSSFGLVVIEVRGDQVYVDGELVQPAAVPESDACFRGAGEYDSETGQAPASHPLSAR